MVHARVRETHAEMKKVKFVYNPHSGETLITNYIDEIIAIYQRRGFTIVPYRLTFEGDPAEMLADMDDSYDHLLLAGGDGTVNFMVNLLKSRGLDIPVAILPTGTANDFATLLGVPSSIPAACRGFLDGEVRSVDLGRVNGEWFVNVFSCGLFTDVSQKTPTVLKNSLGRLAYFVGGVGELAKLRKMSVGISTDNGSYEGSSLIFLVFNGQTAGGFRLAFQSKLDDGKLDVLIIKGDNPLETAQTVFHFLARMGVAQRLLPTERYPAGIVHIQCSRIEAVSESDEQTDIDGQAGPHFPLTITCEPGALRVLVPRTGE